MQNTESDNNEYINPDHFPSTSSEIQSKFSTITSATVIATSAQAPLISSERTQNFSFSTNYKFSNSSNSTTNTKFSNSPLPSTVFHFNPNPSFTILNNDELSTLTAGKPNAIVRPIRRSEQSAAGLPYQQGDNETSNSPPDRASQSKQHLALEVSSQPLPGVQYDQYFTEELNRKLSFLHQYHHINRNNGEAWTKSRNSSRNHSNQGALHNRPLFITTVPTGVFLPPAKEPPMPWFLKPRIYAYSSHPVVLNTYDNFNTNNNGSSSRSKNPKFSKDNQFQASSVSITTATTAAIASAPIATSDNELMKNTTHLAGIRGGYTHSLAGGVHLTKQQFQQQIQQRRTKREIPADPYKNVMYDRRIVRGSNFGGTQLLVDSDPFDKAAELRRRHALRKKTICRNQRNVLGTPPPVAGRRHEVIQTEKYLEELVERPPEFSVDTQTDLFLERPPTPPYIPAKVGIDVGTEIGEGELFHFDAEAQPIIDILVDACIEQSMLEVAHEQELEALRKKQEEFLAQREAELAELRRLEAEEIRLLAEKERRLRQDTIAKALDEEMQKGVTAAKLLQGHIAGLLPEVLENLEPATDAAKKEQLMKTICPWLTVEVAEEVGSIVDSREILTVIIQEIIKQRAEVYAGYKEETPSEQLKQEPYDNEEEGLGEQEPECCVCETEPSVECPQSPPSPPAV